MRNLLILVLFSLFALISANGIRGGAERVFLFHVYRLQQEARKAGAPAPPAIRIALGCVGTVDDGGFKSCDFDEFLKHINGLSTNPNLVSKIEDPDKPGTFISNLFPELELTSKRVNSRGFSVEFTNFGNIVSGATGYTNLLQRAGIAFAQTRALFPDERVAKDRIDESHRVMQAAVEHRDLDYQRKFITALREFDYTIPVKTDEISMKTGGTYVKFNLEKTVREVPVNSRAALRTRITNFERSYKTSNKIARDHAGAIRSLETAQRSMGPACA